MSEAFEIEQAQSREMRYLSPTLFNIALESAIREMQTITTEIATNNKV